MQGVLGPLLDTLLMEVLSQDAGAAGANGQPSTVNGRVVANCRAYMQQEEKPGRDVQVCGVGREGRPRA